MLVVARSLGSNKWGLLSVANSVVNIAQLFQNIGYQDALITYVSYYKHLHQPGDVRQFVKGGLLLSLGATAVIMTILWGISDYVAIQIYNEPELSFFIRLLSISLIGRALMFVSYGVTIGYERMKYRGALRITYTLLKSIISPFLILLGYGIYGGVLGEVGPVILTGVIGIIIVNYLLKEDEITSPELSLGEVIKRIIIFCGPIYFANLVTSIRPQIITFMLGSYLGEEVAGNWTVVLWFSSLLAFINIPIKTSILPLLSKLTDKDELNFIYVYSIKYASILIYPLAFGVMALSSQLVSGLFGIDYLYAAKFLRLYMVSFLFIGIGSLSNTPLLKSQRHTKETLYIQIVQFLVTIPSIPFVISRFGAVGVITLFLLGVTASKLYSCYTIRRIFGFYPDFSSSIKFFLSGLTAFIVTHRFGCIISFKPWIELLLGGILFLVIYLIGIYLSKAVSHEDKRLLLRLDPVFGRFVRLFDIFIRN